MGKMSGCVALLGDSIFDNRAYTNGEPDVVEHLQAVLPAGWVVELLASDGSSTEDIAEQAAELTPDVSRILLSVGGNDALLNADILNLPVASTREALHLFAARIASFEQGYRAAIAAVTAHGAPVTVCTIYDGNLPEKEALAARVALMLFNDVILRVAFELKLGVVDLRLVCSDPSDYANPIEPSGRGGRKIAHAILASLGFSQPAARDQGCIGRPT